MVLSVRPVGNDALVEVAFDGVAAVTVTLPLNGVLGQLVQEAGGEVAAGAAVEHPLPGAGRRCR